MAGCNLEAAAREILAVLSRFGEWDDQCFYYGGNSASELQKPMQDLADAIECVNHRAQALTLEGI